IEHDRNIYCKFATLQSAAGRDLAQKHGLSAAIIDADEQTAESSGKVIDSVILIENGKAYTHSEAAVRIAQHLTAPWSWLRWVRVVPKFVRDAAYKLFARHRYKLFGRKDACMIPTPDVRARFLS
ncbi:MAG: DCC1-like thiol-disulfide oxidoreductase family protein, partial [Acidobacteriota bacterium]